MKATYPLVANVIAVLMAVGLARGEEAAKSTEGSAAAQQQPSAKRLTDPTILLVRDEAVRKEIELSADQVDALDALLRQHNRILLAIRDVSPSGADETAQPAIKEIRSQLKELLDPQQRLRMQNLILQAQGYDALSRRDVAARLKLSADQLRDLVSIRDDVRTQLGDLQKTAATGSPEEQAEQLAELNADRHRRTLAVLDADQQQEWAKLLGEPFDFSQVRPSPAWAPEFEGIEAWFNSEPLTMESLRGQVVVVHFFAFGCINCIHNYPWYREWQQDLAGKGVTIIGIHTPETTTETDNQLLAASLTQNQLTFPVAVDKEKKMWQAWYNGIWPSVYLVDKRGRVRYWWYGELDWEGAGQQKVARQKIEALLAEPTTAQAEAESPASATREPSRTSDLRSTSKEGR